MLKNYFITAINNLLKNKLYSAINIIGLAVGLAACILITLYVQDELSYDRHWENADLIYRVDQIMKLPNGPSETIPHTSSLALPALKKYFPADIEFGTRIQTRSVEIQIGDLRYEGLVSKVDKDFPNIFQVEVIKGSLKNTLQNPGNIALSEETAARYFGDKDPIGEIITSSGYGDEEQYQVTAVFRPISSNTVLNIPCLSLLDETKLGPSNWFMFTLETFIRFNESADIDKFIDRLPEFVNEVVTVNTMMRLPPGTKISDAKKYSLQKMSDIYFNPSSELLSDRPPIAGNKTVITVFMIISGLVLVIGCVNFIILTTAKATQRAREVAMRKVVGARFKQLLFQFLGETILIALISFIFSIGITEMSLPFFESFVNKELTVPYSSLGSYLFVIILILIVGLLGGLYPAFVLSRFSPTQALKANQTTEADGSIRLRNLLVIFQFAASISLIMATIVAYIQLVHASKHDPGFNPKNLLVIQGIARPDIAQYKSTLQQELLKIPEVVNVGLSTLQPKMVGGGIQLLSPLRRKTDDSTPGEEQMINNLRVDYNFFDTYEIPLLSGRYFTQSMDQEESSPALPLRPSSQNNREIKNRRIILNLSAARQFGFASADDAVGKFLESGDPGTPFYSEYEIIGVVEDSQYRSLRMKPESELYHLSPDSTMFLAVRYRGDYQTAVNEVKRVWHEVVGDVLFTDSNVKQNLATTFSQEEKENKALIAFALLSVFISCMGLFGMASFTVDRRVKEIGLRKVMGAKVKDIVRLLVWQFLKPVLIANIIAWPVAIFAMQSWLERFPYRFDPLLMIPICLCSGLLALAIAWLTVAGNTTRVAKSNPIHALRYE